MESHTPMGAPMLKMALPIGACCGLVGVAAGAFGAHALKALLQPDMLQAFEVGVRYQLYHALALIAVGIQGRFTPLRAFELAVRAFLFGILLFSGSLYVLALSGLRWIGALTPFGGVGFLVGWACLAWGSWTLAHRE
jgi:uncharacterized membrane protein YgdD (TMEM256/DUF423 family)